MAAASPPPSDPDVIAAAHDPALVMSLRQQFATVPGLKEAVHAALVADGVAVAATDPAPPAPPATTTPVSVDPEKAARAARRRAMHAPPASTPALAASVAPVAPSAPAMPTPDPPLLPSPILRIFGAKVPEGYRPLPPALVYTAAGNGYQPFDGAAVDLYQWGSRRVIVMLCDRSVSVIDASGAIVEIPPRVPIAMPVDTDLHHLATLVAENPETMYIVNVAPSVLLRDDGGVPIVRYLVSVAAELPKKGVWPPPG
jgi:hypothetical protein